MHSSSWTLIACMIASSSDPDLTVTRSLSLSLTEVSLVHVALDLHRSISRHSMLHASHDGLH